MSAIQQMLLVGAKPFPTGIVGQQAYTTPGTYSFPVPSGVTSVCIVAVGAGGRGGTANSASAGGGGALSYSNAVPVTPGESLSVYVGGVTEANLAGGNSYVRRGSTNLVLAKGGNGGTMSSNPGLGGSAAEGVGEVRNSGGRGYGADTYSVGYGGGGAAGYSGNGGAGADFNQYVGSDAPPGGGGGGGGGSSLQGGAGGGGVGLLGEGASGAGGDNAGGYGGSNGTNGNYDSGGSFGGGGGKRSTCVPGAGGVRIIWGGNRKFPSDNTQDF